MKDLINLEKINYMQLLISLLINLIYQHWTSFEASNISFMNIDFESRETIQNQASFTKLQFISFTDYKFSAKYLR